MKIQAMMKQAQKLQKDMMSEKSKIDEMIFTSKKSFVTVNMKGTKEVVSVLIENDTMEKDDIEMLQDLILVCVNDCIHQIDNETEKRLGKYTQGMPGLF